MESQSQIKSLEEDRNTLREKLAVELAKGDIDINAITSKMVAEQLEVVHEKYRKEMRRMRWRATCNLKLTKTSNWNFNWTRSRMPIGL